MLKHSIALRVALPVFLGMAAILLGAGLFLLSAADRHFEELDQAELGQRLQVLAGVLAQTGSADGLRHLEQEHHLLHSGHGTGGSGIATRIATPAGEVLHEAAPFPADAATLETLQRGAAGTPPALLSWEFRGQPWRGMASRLPSGVPALGAVDVMVAMDISHHSAFMALYRQALGTALVVALLLALGISGLTVRWGLAPLKQFAALAREVSAARLSARLHTDELPRELVALAGEFNQMLQRLEDAFRRLSDFSSDIAHELRTPLSNLLVETQVALSRPRDAQAYAEVLYSNLEEYERLSRMIADMLFLARADNGLVTPSRETVDLARLVDGLFEFFEAAAEDRDLRLQRDGEGCLQGDRLMLQRALSNLLSNALRHAQAHSVVRVSIGSEGETGLCVAVANQGAPIAPEHLPRLFDRFYQADPARQRKSDGAGLGLAITRSIVEAHGGHIDADSRDGVNRFCMRFPG